MRQCLELVRYILPAALEYPSGDWNGFRVYRPAREGRSCEHFGGYKTINRIPLCPGRDSWIWKQLSNHPIVILSSKWITIYWLFVNSSLIRFLWPGSAWGSRESVCRPIFRICRNPEWSASLISTLQIGRLMFPQTSFGESEIELALVLVYGELSVNPSRSATGD